MNAQNPNNQPSSFRKVVRDIVDLLELQMELLSVDSQAARRKMSRAVTLGIVAIALGGSALTVCMIGGGFLLAQFTDLSTGGGLLIIGGSAFVIVAVLLGVAWSAVSAAIAAMAETKSEFAENMRWLKATLIAPSTSARNQLRRESFPFADSESADQFTKQALMRSGSAVDQGNRNFR